MTKELIVTARKLAKANPMKPRQADLKRAVSTANYALFHTLAHTCADRLIGTGLRRDNPAWRQVYRSLEHGFARSACERSQKLGFPDEIVRFGNAFVRLQKERHDADYDPAARFTKPEVALLIAQAEQAIRSLNQASNQDKTAFAALVLLKQRKV